MGSGAPAEKPGQETKNEKAAKRFANVAVVLAVVGLCFVIYRWLGQDPETNACAPPEVAGAIAATGEPADPATAATGKQADPATPTVPDGSLTTFALGTDLNSGPRSVPFTLSAPITGDRQVAVAAGPFADPTTGRQIPSDQVEAWASVDQSGGGGAATICITPDGREKGPWGTFTGSINFEDDRIAATPITVTVAQSYPERQTVFLVWVLACVLASSYVYFLRDQPVDKGTGQPVAETALRWPFEFLHRYWNYMTTSLGAITLAAGFVAAFVVAQSQYLSGTAWSASVTDWATFCGAAAAAFVAGATTGRLAQNRYAPPLPPGAGGGSDQSGQVAGAAAGPTGGGGQGDSQP